MKTTIKLFIYAFLIFQSYSVGYSEPREIVLSDGRIVTIRDWYFDFESAAREDGSLCTGEFTGLAPTKSGELIEYALNAKGPIDATGATFNVDVFDVFPVNPHDWPKMKGALGLRNCKTVLEKGVIPIFIEEGILNPDGSFIILGDQVRLESKSLGSGVERPAYISKHSMAFQCDPEALQNMGLMPGLSTEELINLIDSESVPNIGGVIEAGGDIPIIPKALPCDDIPKIPLPDGAHAPGKVPRPRGSSSWDDFVRRLFH